MIKDTTACAYEEVYSLSKRSGLIFDVDTTVDCQRMEFMISMLQPGQFILHLDGKLARRSQNNCLNLSSSKQVLLSEVFSHREAEGQGFATSSEITCNYIFSVVDWVKALSLDREKVLVSATDQLRSRCSHNFWEARKLAILHSIVCHALCASLQLVKINFPLIT